METPKAPERIAAAFAGAAGPEGAATLLEALLTDPRRKMNGAPGGVEGPA